MEFERLRNHEWDTSIDPDVVPLFLNLQWAHVRSLESMRPTLARFGLSLAEFDVLATLRNAKAPYQMTPKEIQAEVVITSGGLTKIMLQLESRHLLVRMRNEEDLRVKPLRLTPEGRRLVETAMRQVVREVGDWTRGALSRDEMRSLTRLLSKIAA